MKIKRESQKTIVYKLLIIFGVNENPKRRFQRKPINILRYGKFDADGNYAGPIITESYLRIEQTLITGKNQQILGENILI